MTRGRPPWTQLSARAPLRSQEKAGQMAGDELEEAVVKMVMRELFEDLAKLHKARAGQR